MPIAMGTTEYDVGCPPVAARGLSHFAAELNAALDGPVRTLIADEDGKRKARETTSSLSLTDFERENLDAILNREDDLEDWRVGEAYGEAYLTEHRGCRFPWPDTWDERKCGSSLPGADLVGFQHTNHKTLPHRFAFGEVKTSYENKYPPSLMYGRTGLKRQIEDLRNSKRIRDDLFRYLSLRANNADWNALWVSSVKRYLNDGTDIAIVGVLIRDVAPDKADLSGRAAALADGKPSSMHIELLAIYLPKGSIVGFAKFYKSPTKGG